MELTFGELQMDKRYKKLERALKLALLRRSGISTADNRGEASSLPISYTDFSVNRDSIESNFTNLSLGTSKLESEIFNIKNRNSVDDSNFSMPKETRENVFDDNALVSSPNLEERPRNPNKTPTDRPKGEYRSRAPPEIRTKSMFVSIDSGISDNVHTSIPRSEAFNLYKHDNSLCTDCNSTRTERIRIFSKWRVILNERCQLLIKGTLKCGKVARSKPVIRRFSATSVQSMFNHVYYLEGNIVDNRNELPDYVRGKFYNGFPDDWENVYQIWRTFIDQGCKLNFRWPMEITDSDDDLRSEITDITVLHEKAHDGRPSKSEFFGNRRAADISTPALPSDGLLTNRGTCGRLPSPKDPKNTLRRYDSSTKGDSTYRVTKENSLQNSSSKDYSERSESADSCQSYIFKRVNKLQDIIREDKYNVIINNLANKDCPQEYFNKIIEIFDRLNYVTSYEAPNDAMLDRSTDDSMRVQNRIARNTNDRENLCENVGIGVRKECTANDANRSFDDRSAYNNRQSCERKIVDVEKGKCIDKCESEVYAGVPKLSFEKLLQNRISHKERHRKSLSISGRYNTMEKRRRNSRGILNDKEMSNERNMISYNLSNNCTDDEDQDETCLVMQRNNERKINNLRATEYNPNEEEIDDVNAYNSESTKISGTTGNGNERTFFSRERSKLINASTEMTKSEETNKYDGTDETQNQIVSLKCRYKRKMSSTRETGPTNIKKCHLYTSKSANSNEICNSNEVNYDNFSSGSSNINTKENRAKEVSTCAPLRSINSNRKFKSSKHVHDTKRESTEKEKETSKSSKRYGRGTDVQPRSAITIESNNAQKEEFNKSTDGASYKEAKAIITNVVTLNKNVKLIKDKSKDSFEQYPNAIHSDNGNGNSIETRLSKLIDKETRSLTNEVMFNECNAHAVPNVRRSNRSKIQKINNFGTVNNPKVLSGWAPRVLYNPKSDTKLGLIFEGKLHNEAGHIVDRSFTTDFVHERLSARLIETTNHEFYSLVDDLNHNKYAGSKLLLQQCRNGCPSNIQNFCKIWIILETGGTFENKSDEIETLNVSISSRGRKILPSLSYWIGERVALKNNHLVYSSGSSKTTTIISSNDNHDEHSKEDEKQSENRNTRNSDIRKNQQLRDLRSVSENEKSKKNMNSMKKQNVDINSYEKENVSGHEERYFKDRHSDENRHSTTYKYYRNIPLKDDMLSDDQISQI